MVGDGDEPLIAAFEDADDMADGRGGGFLVSCDGSILHPPRVSSVPTNCRSAGHPLMVM